MRTHGIQPGPYMKRRWWSPFIESLPVAMIVMVTVHPSGLAAAADMPGWEPITPTRPAHSLTVTQDCPCGLLPYLNNSRFVLGRADNLDITALTACRRPYSIKMPLLAHPTLGLLRQVNPRMQTLSVSIVSYNSKKSLLKIRTTLPEINRLLNSTPVATVIGPVQELQNSPPADEQSMTQTILSVPPMDNTSSPFGHHTWGPFNQFEGLQRLPNGESHRMNMTTASALHGKDCASDCP